MKIVDVFICKLRSKLNSVGANGMIGTVWGQGYTIRKIGKDGAAPQTMVVTAAP